MKKLFSLLLIAILLCSVSAIAADNVLDAQIEVRHADLERTHYKLSLLAEGFSNYLKELGGDNSKLETIRSEFDSLKPKLLSDDTNAELNADIAQAKTLIDQFVVEYNTQLAAVNGDAGAGLIKALTFYGTHQAEVDALDAQYWAVNKENSLYIFDTNVKGAQDFIDWMSTNGYDTTPLEDILDQIKSKRADLESGLSAKNPVVVQGTVAAIGQLAQKFGQTADSILKGGKP